MLEQYKERFSDLVYKRALHIVEENERVVQGLRCLENNDIYGFGRLMFESHWSSSKNYEVSCRELDFLIEFASNFNGVIGAKLSGGGFGGCTVNLVESDKAERFCASVQEAYNKEFPVQCIVNEVEIGEGAGAELVSLQ